MIGGDGTLAIAHELQKRGVPMVGVPKTIDNDIVETTMTFGFDTAVAFATDAIDRLHSTAEAHHRVMVVEVMGRYAGWIALHSGIAGGADVVLIPELPYDLELVAEHIRARERWGARFSIVVAAEGAYRPAARARCRRWPRRIGWRSWAGGRERRACTRAAHRQGMPACGARTFAARAARPAVTIACWRRASATTRWSCCSRASSAS